MPEGDTIYRAVQRLKPVLTENSIVEASDNGRFIDSRSLLQHHIRQVEAKGKHLLMHLDDGRVLHSHMGMTGSWHVYSAGQPWTKPVRSAAVSMTVDPGANRRATIVCFSPKLLDLLTPTQFRRHDYLSRLGPDLMVDELDDGEILGRFRVHNLSPIGVSIMNQTIVCGIGNVYKSECLFLTQTNPFVAVQQLSDERILQILQSAQWWMRKNVGGRPRQTRMGWMDGDCGFMDAKIRRASSVAKRSKCVDRAIWDARRIGVQAARSVDLAYSAMRASWAMRPRWSVSSS